MNSSISRRQALLLSGSGALSTLIAQRSLRAQDVFDPVVPFSERLLPALQGIGFRQEDYWVWCGSVIQNDGSVTTQGSIERPFIFFRNDRPAFLFAATADGPGPHDGQPGHYYAKNTWNMVIPLKCQ